MAISEDRRLTYTDIALAVTGVVTGMILGSVGQSEASPPAENLDVVTADLYQNNCAPCHGAAGGGTDVGPPLSQAKRAPLDKSAITEAVLSGRPGTAMAPFMYTLSADEVDALVDFIMRALEHGGTPTQPTEPAVDAASLYQNMCASCHGEARAGTALAPPLTPNSLAPLDRATISDAIVNGKPKTAMLAFKNTLSPDEVNALVAFITETSP